MTACPSPNDRCGARHPSNTSVIPCLRPAGHAGGHWSETGCAGSSITWHGPGPAWTCNPAEHARLAAVTAAAAKYLDASRTYKDATRHIETAWQRRNAAGEALANAPTDLADLLAEREKLLAVAEAADAVVAAEYAHRWGPTSEVIGLRTRLRAYRATTGEAGQ